MSIEGYSFGVTFFDVVGSAGNAATYLMRDRLGVPLAHFFIFFSDWWKMIHAMYTSIKVALP